MNENVRPEVLLGIHVRGKKAEEEQERKTSQNWDEFGNNDYFYHKNV